MVDNCCPIHCCCKYYKFNEEYVRIFGRNDDIIYRSKPKTTDKSESTLIELEGYGCVDRNWLTEVDANSLLVNQNCCVANLYELRKALKDIEYKLTLIESCKR